MVAAPCLLAQSNKDEDKGKDKGGSQSTGQHKTISGIVAGVTVLGETMVDHESGRAITAERDYLTVVDAERHGDKGDSRAGHGQQASSGEKKPDAKADRDVKQTSGADEASRGAGSGSEQGSKRSARVYLVEVTPKTEVCECQKDGKKKCELSRLEIGDHVEIDFQPYHANPSQNQAGTIRHGRHRMMRGQALSIAILQDDINQDKSSGSPSEHSPEGSKGESK